MIIRIGFLQKKKDLTTEQFFHHWKGRHAEIVSQLPFIYQYLQNHIINKSVYVQNENVEVIDIAGMSQIWYENEEKMRKSYSSAIIPTLYEDEKVFIEKLNVFTFQENEVIKPNLDQQQKKFSLALTYTSPDQANEINQQIKTSVTSQISELPYILGLKRYDLVDGKEKIQDEKVRVDSVFELYVKDQQYLKEVVNMCKKFCSIIRINEVQTYTIVAPNDPANNL